MELQTFYKDWKLLFYSVDRSCVKLYIQSQQKSNLCPSCNMPSSYVHSRYWRVIQDITILSLQVFLHVRARKFFCDHSACSQRIFTERPSDWWPPYARRTNRLTTFLKHLAFSLSAETASVHWRSWYEYSQCSLLEHIHKIRFLLLVQPWGRHVGVRS